jgi:hypothetical protein
MSARGPFSEIALARMRVLRNIGFLGQQVNAICQSLSDPWASIVVAIGAENNPIIQDENEKVSLYLKNLTMLWELGIATSRRQMGAISASNIIRRMRQSKQAALED